MLVKWFPCPVAESQWMKHVSKSNFSAAFGKKPRWLEIGYYLNKIKEKKKKRWCSLEWRKLFNSSHIGWERSSPPSRRIVFLQNGTPLADTTARKPIPNTLQSCNQATNGLWEKKVHVPRAYMKNAFLLQITCLSTGGSNFTLSFSLKKFVWSKK